MLAVEFAHQVEYGIGGVTVEIAGWFVGQNAGGPRDQRTRDGHALALAAGQLAGTMGESMAQTHFVQHFGCACHRLLIPQTADDQRHGSVFQCGKLGQQVMKLIDEAQRGIAQFATCRLGNGKGILPPQFDVAPCRRIEPPQQVQQRALARP